MAKEVRSNLDFLDTARIVNLPEPLSIKEPATKGYVDSAIEGLSWKDNCRVATQSNVNLAAPGASIDGITMVAGDRVLVRAQTAGADNGIYTWAAAASPMTRAADCSTAVELEQAVTSIDEGTSASTSYRQTAINFALGVGAIAWATFGTATPSASETTSGTAELATQAEVDAGSDDTRIVTPLKLATWSGRVRKLAVNIGDGSATQYDVTHNFNTEDVDVTVYRPSGAKDDVLCDVSRPSVNAVRINFASPPTTNQFRVVVMG